MKENGEIENVKEFNKIMGDPYKGDSFIVITDTSNKDIIHLVLCKSIKHDNFVEKVADNKGKNGRYYWFQNYGDAKSKFRDATDCKNCVGPLRRY